MKNQSTCFDYKKNQYTISFTNKNEHAKSSMNNNKPAICSIWMFILPMYWSKTYNKLVIVNAHHRLPKRQPHKKIIKLTNFGAKSKFWNRGEQVWNLELVQPEQALDIESEGGIVGPGFGLTRMETGRTGNAILRKYLENVLGMIFRIIGLTQGH